MTATRRRMSHKHNRLAQIINLRQGRLSRKAGGFAMSLIRRVAGLAFVGGLGAAPLQGQSRVKVFLVAGEADKQRRGAVRTPGSVGAVRGPRRRRRAPKGTVRAVG